MIRKTYSLLLAAVLVIGVVSASSADDKKKAAAPTCPACKMELSAKKDDKTPVGIAVGKKVMYCCSGCDMKAWEKDKKGNLIPPKK